MFETGEYTSDETFKVDGIIKYEDTECCLLETFGPFGISDNGRFGGDHVKGTFGTLTFLRKILQTYHYATEDTLLELKVIFVHARGEITTRFKHYTSTDFCLFF